MATPAPTARLRASCSFKAAAGEPFKLLELQGGLANDNGIKRSKCLNNAFVGHDNIKVVAQVPTNWNPEKALAGTENAMQAHPDLNGIYAPWNDALQGIFPLLKAKNVLLPVGDPKHIIIVSIDGTPLGCKAMKDKLMMSRSQRRCPSGEAGDRGGGEGSQQADHQPGDRISARHPLRPGRRRRNGAEDLGLPVIAAPDGVLGRPPAMRN